MAEITLSKFTEGRVSEDGKVIQLDFAAADGTSVTVSLSDQELSRIMLEFYRMLARAQELSGMRRQGIVTVLRPTEAQVSLLPDKRTVRLSLTTPDSGELQFAFESRAALEFFGRALEAAQDGIRTIPPRLEDLD
jgi:hypothetical protein